MGSSGEPITKGIDPTVGGLVWVRRRNGSWWPGRVMGLDELPEDCLVSPKMGTPVKLLGREDASVDWYNLERSKRVKAFRCGEYDNCIEKAKAAANANKKAVKYVRREDAILHALELESARQSKDRTDFCARRDNSGSGQDGTSSRDSSTMLHSVNTEDSEEVSDSEDTSTSAQELSQSSISFEEPNHISVPKVKSVQGRRRITPNDSEDDGEGFKRMRGLEDLGMGAVSNKKVQGLQAGEVLEEVQQDNALLYNSNNRISVGSPANGRKCHFPSLKRKRSQVSRVHEFLKRKNRRRPLTKVLESTAMVSIPVMYDQLLSPGALPLHGLFDSKVSRLESNESKMTISVVINNSSDSTCVSYEKGTLLNASDVSHSQNKLKENVISSMSLFYENDSSDMLFDVPLVEEEEKYSAGFSHIFASSSGKPTVGAPGRQSSQGSQAETVLLRNEGLHESGLTTSAATYKMSRRMERGTSKWQSKGRRNSRHTSKSIKHDHRNSVDADDESNGYLAGVEQIDGISVASDLKVDSSPGLESLTSDGFNLRAKSKPVKENTTNGFPHWSKHVSRREPHMPGISSDATILPDSSLIPQRSLPYRPSRFSVHPKYQMEDFSTTNHSQESSLYDVILEVKASYRPQHVPLVSLMSKLNGKAIVGHPLTVEVMDEGTSDKLVNSNECYPRDDMSALEDGGLGYAVKSKTDAGRVARFSPSKSPKTKRCSFLLKKTRKLSSLTSCQKLRGENRNGVVVKLNGPAIACIPLKVVFSRLNEAVSGSSRSSRHVLTSSIP